MSTPITTPSEAFLIDTQEAQTAIHDNITPDMYWSPVTFIDKFKINSIIWYNNKRYIKITGNPNNTITPDLNTTDWKEFNDYINSLITNQTNVPITDIQQQIAILTNLTISSYGAFLSEDNSNGTAITSVNSNYPCYIGNGQIVYSNNSDGKLYLKSATGTDNGTAITSVISYDPCYIGNGQIVYRNNSNGSKFYLKSSTGADNGTAITSVNSNSPCYIGNGKIVYSNNSDGGKLYLKNLFIYK